MTAINERLSELQSIGVKEAGWAAIRGIGAAAVLSALFGLWMLFALVAYEVFVLAGIPMDEPSTTLLVLRFPVELPVFVAFPVCGALVMRLSGSSISIRDTALAAAAVYALLWTALLAAGVETTWVF